MRAVTRLALKYILRQKRKSISVIAVIALATIISIVVVNINKDFKEEAYLTARVVPNGFYHLSTDFTSEIAISDAINAIDANHMIGYSSYSVQKYLGSAKLEHERNIVIYGIDANTPDYEQVRLVNGQFPSRLNEVCIEENLIQLLGGIDIGDHFEIELTLYSGEIITQQFILSGILRTMPNRARYQNEYGIIYTHNETVDKLYRENSPPIKILLRLREDYKWAFNNLEHMYTIENILHEATGINWSGKHEYVGIFILSENSIANYAVPAVFIISAVIIFGIFNISLTSRNKQYALLRQLGMSRHIMFYMILFEAAILAFIGWFAGAIAGIALYQFVFRSILSNFWDAAITNSLDILYLVGTFILCVGISIISCIIPAVKVLKTNIEQKIKNPKKLFKKKDFQNSRFFLLNTFIRDRKNIIVAISLIISISVGIFITFTSSRMKYMSKEALYDYDFEIYIDAILTEDGYIFEDCFNYNVFEEVLAIEGAKDVWGSYTYLTDIDIEFERIFTNDPNEKSKYYIEKYQYDYIKNELNGIINMPIRIIAGDEQMFKEAFRDGIINDNQYEAVSMNTTENIKVVAVPNISIQIYDAINSENIVYVAPHLPESYIPLFGSIEYAYNGGMRVLDISVNTPDELFLAWGRGRAAFFHTGFFVLNNNFFQSEEKRYHLIRIDADDDADHFHIKQELYKLLLPYKNAFIIDAEEEFMRNYNYLRNLLLAMWMVAVLVFAAMLFNVFNTIMAATDERRKIYASLRTIGMDYSSLRKMIFMEIVFVSIIASIIGFILGLSATLFISRNLITNSSLITVLSQNPWGNYIILFFVNILFAVLMSFICVNSNKFKENIELL